MISAVSLAEAIAIGKQKLTAGSPVAIIPKAVNTIPILAQA